MRVRQGVENVCWKHDGWDARGSGRGSAVVTVPGSGTHRKRHAGREAGSQSQGSPADRPAAGGAAPEVVSFCLEGGLIRSRFMNTRSVTHLGVERFIAAGLIATLAACAEQPVAPLSRALQSSPSTPSANLLPGGGTVVVRPSTAAANGWTDSTTNNAVGSYVPGPGGQPGGLQSGSLKFETKSSPGGKPQFITSALVGVKLAELTSLRYSSYIAAYASGGQHLTHTLNLSIDRDGDLTTTTDRHNMVYEPCYTTSCSGAIQPLNTWATWDARAAGAIWWSTSIVPGTDFTTASGSYKPLTTILSAYPNAAVLGVFVQAGQGSGNAPWNDFVGYVDGFAATVNSVTTTYDFEPDDAAPPVVTNVVASPNPAPVSGVATVTADVSDVATGGSNIVPAEYSVDGGPWSAMSASDLAFDEATESVTAAITAPATAGIYNVCVRGTDALGNTSTAVCTSLVVYDPSAGFVTGGGWIDSPADAYAADPNLSGKATFGFVSKYQKGKSTPTGQTEFVFNAANLNFHSSAYDWLVVNQAGTNAQFKGSGTINGAGNYSFMLWASDGDKDTNPSTLDTFRIKIWDSNTSQVVYDNQADTAISGGNIIVHVPKK